MNAKLDLPNGINSEKFLELTRQLVRNVAKARENVDLNRNVLDPFSAAIEAKMSGQSLVEWLSSEKTRQAQKSLTNQLGIFHQEMLGLLPGWESTGSSGGNYDLIHREPFSTACGNRPVIAEVKNKHNTMNSSSMNNLRTNFNSYLRQPEHRGYVAYLIQVIPKNGAKVDVPWKVSGFGEIPEVRVIDAATVYSRSTGDPEAFKKVFSAIPVAIDIVNGSESREEWNRSPWEELFKSSLALK